jgi:glycosyltransferase involved in cell wall biosynthesis
VPRVSILLTCFNHIRFLPACVEGVRAQAFTDYEIIAIDDGSADGSREWLSKNLQDSKVIFNETNLGTYATLNRALKSASGEFIAVLNDDDLWAPRKLEAQLELFEKNPKVGLVHTDGGFIDGDGHKMEGSPLGFEFPRTKTGNVVIPLIYANKIIASAALVKRNCFDQLGGFNSAYFGSGDWEMWLRIAEKWDVGYVDEKLTHYRVHGANASHKLDRIWRDDEKLRLWIRSKYDDYRRLRLDVSELTKAMAHNEACLGTVQMLNGEAGAARESYRRSLKLDPSRLKSRLRLWATYALPRTLWRKVL